MEILPAGMRAVAWLNSLLTLVSVSTLPCRQYIADRVLQRCSRLWINRSTSWKICRQWKCEYLWRYFHHILTPDSNNMREWVGHFSSKYTVVGKLVNEGEE